MKMNLTAQGGQRWARFFTWALMAVTELKTVNLEILFLSLKKGKLCGIGEGVPTAGEETKILILMGDHGQSM